MLSTIAIIEDTLPICLQKSKLLDLINKCNIETTIEFIYETETIPFLNIVLIWTDTG